MIITIPGRPIPAVRMTQKTKWNKASKRYLAYKDTIGIFAKRIYPTPTSENVSVKVRVYLSGKTTPMGGEGDVDNYAKSALDGCNKIAFVDDRQVMDLTVSKEPCKELDQRMEIEISEIEGMVENPKVKKKRVANK